MSPWPVEGAPVEEVHLPRPGHADLAGLLKFGLTDVRDVLERASARETAARVAGGAVCKEFLRTLGVEVVSHVRQIGTVLAPAYPEPLGPQAFADVDSSPVRCLDADASRAMVEHIDIQRKANESLGGVFEVRAYRARHRTGLARVLGGAPRRPPRGRAVLDPVGQGRQHRRGLRARRQARLGRPTTRSSIRPSAGSTARPTAPAGSRAASPTASR